MADTSTYPAALDGDLRPLVPAASAPSGMEDFFQLLADAVSKIETELGTNPSGAAATVAAAIAAKLDTATAAATYAPLSSATRVWLDAGRFFVQGGAPAQTGNGGGGSVRGWLFDASSSENIVAQEFLDESWATFDIDMYWLNQGAGAGDVRWRVDVATQAVGDATPTTVSSTSVTRTAGAANVMMKSIHVAGVTANAALPHRLSVLRLGADAADTLADDALFIGLMLRKAS